MIRGEPERAPNIHKKPEAVYLFARDLAQQLSNAHAQTPALGQ